MRVETVEIGAVTIRYRQTGRPGGPPVVLLHGGSSSATTWDRLAGELAAAGRRVIAADLRGHGGSSRMATYPLTGYCEDVIGLLDALALDSVALVGHSLGAYAASLVAQSHPSRVARLVLEEIPAPSRDASSKHELSMRRLLLPALAVLALRRGCDWRAVTSAIRQLRLPDPEWWDRLAAVTAPTLIVSGGRRSHVSPQRLAEVARTVRDGRLVTIPVGHRVHSVSPERFQSVVVPFLTSAEAS